MAGGENLVPCAGSKRLRPLTEFPSMRRSQPVLSLFCSIGFFLSFFHSSAASLPPAVQRSQILACNSKDRDALVGFFGSLTTSIPGWPLNASSDCCRWPGVQCGVPSSWRNSDSRVVGLELGWKNLEGGVPGRFLLGLDGLHTLNLSHNSLSGSIPAEMFRLPELEVVDLSNNLFSGDLTVNLTSLRHLDISHNLFSGSIQIGDLSVLRDLDISFNSFSGSIPNIFHRLGTLQRFSARANNFTGFLPASLSTCSTLTSLDLGNNSLTGEIGLDFTRLVRLRTLRLDSNRFVGHVPENLSSCRGLEILSLADNNLDGQIPRSFKNLQALYSLSLSDNGFFNVSRALAILSECRNLTVLFLNTNFRLEKMPSDGIVGFEGLKALVVANCSLWGSIPSWLRTCGKLRLLDLSFNLLSGVVPPWLGNFVYLSYLDLSNNLFGGALPRTLAHMKCLTSKNCPQADNSPIEFLVPARQDRTLLLLYSRFSRIPPTLDLGHNMLDGSIMKDFGSLTELLVLNLSHNNFSGTIPEELSGLRKLEYLDLSHNNLSGEIPLPFVRMTFLSWFSVAYNHLGGRIPGGGQFISFPDSSFEGNADLCSYFLGFKKCFPTPLVNDTEAEKFRIKFMAFPYGIGVIIGFVPTVAICGLYNGCRRIKKKERVE